MVIVTYGGVATRVARQATATTPIVMAVVQEAVSTGPVTSLARPGGNVTGISSMSPELVEKQLQILEEVVPKVRPAQDGLCHDDRGPDQRGHCPSGLDASRSPDSNRRPRNTEPPAVGPRSE